MASSKAIENTGGNGSKTGLFGLTLGSIGVVYGDIGTSPLYAFSQSLKAMGGEVQPGIVLGLLSLIFWTLIVIVTLKYVMLLLRADHNGEGGILSLTTLAQQALGNRGAWLIMLGMAGSALFYGDAMITPAISVLSAVEGLKLVTSALEHYIITIAMVILIALFIVQRRGTADVGKFFGPIMALWFAVLALGGVSHILERPQVLLAMMPTHALSFLAHHGLAGIIALGSVFLTVTGAEALYADLGHFGKRPIQVAWLFLVMPALLLNYFGQGALVLAHPQAADNPFYLLYPAWAQLPMVILATLATVIASQAVISGAYSMTHQAMQLGILPRMHVLYTSQDNIGQIYIAGINWILMCGVVVLIQIFRSSDALASAYGIAVTGTMLITSVLLLIVARRVWKWGMLLALAVIAPLLLIELTFLGANLTKVLNGGYIPLCISAAVIFLMRTWILGMRTLRQQVYVKANDFEALRKDIPQMQLTRVEGTAVYINYSSVYAPVALIQNLRHNKILHRHNLLLAIEFVIQPYVESGKRLEYQKIDEDFSSIRMRFGTMEPPNILRGLRLLEPQGCTFDKADIVYFLSHRRLMPSSHFGMPVWRDRIFIAMSNMSAHIADYLHLPFNKVVELGVRIKI